MVFIIDKNVTIYMYVAITTLIFINDNIQRLYSYLMATGYYWQQFFVKLNVKKYKKIWTGQAQHGGTWKVQYKSYNAMQCHFLLDNPLCWSWGTIGPRTAGALSSVITYFKLQGCQSLVKNEKWLHLENPITEWHQPKFSLFFYIMILIDHLFSFLLLKSCRSKPANFKILPTFLINICFRMNRFLIHI